MSRLSDIITRLEEVAKKMEMELEHVLDILEGKHPTHTVIVKPVTPPPALPENPTVAAATESSTATLTPTTTSTDSAPIAETSVSDPNEAQTAGSVENPPPASSESASTASTEAPPIEE